MILRTLALTIAALGGVFAARACHADSRLGALAPGILIEQDSKGEKQRLLVGNGSIRIDTVGSRRYVIVRLDKEVVWEIDPDLKMYAETPFKYYRERREKAYEEKAEVQKLIVDKFKGEEREKRLKEANLREDGTFVIRVERGGRERVRTFDTERVTIYENWNPVIEAWVTDDLKKDGYERPPELFQFYEKVGLFHPKVIEAMKGIEGFPVRIRAEIDLSDVGGSLASEVLTVAKADPKPAEFELPSGLNEVPELPEPVPPDAARPPCAVCGKPSNPMFRGPPPLTKYFMCSAACQREFTVNPKKYTSQKPK
jgi:hypothetical protein